MRLRLLSLLIIISSSHRLTAQENTYQFTLEDAIEYALDSSYNALNARRDIAKAIKQKWETTADGLPQIDAKADYQNMLKQPVQLLPAEFFGGDPGTFMPVTFGTKQQMTATATATQLLFDGSYIVGVRAAKTFLEYTHAQAEKTALDIRKSVIDAYGNVLLAHESVTILTQNKLNIEKNLAETRAMFENGLQEEESVEQLQITLLQIENDLNNTQRLAVISQQMLNLTLGIPLSNEITLLDDLDDLAEQNISLSLMNADEDISGNIDYLLAENLIDQRKLELQLEKSAALPKLSAFINYGTSGYNEKFAFFNDNQEWFQSSTLGVSLQVPIFSSFKRQAKTTQAKIALEQAETDLEQTKHQIQLQVKEAKNNYQFAVDNYHNTKKNLRLAERIEHKNQVKYSEGLATSFELRQAQTQLYSVQQELLQAMVDLINAKASLETELNTLNLNFTDKQ